MPKRDAECSSLFRSRPLSPTRERGAAGRPLCSVHPSSCILHSSGFSLVELLVVLAILAVLISLLIPALNLARQSANATACASNLRQLALASITYAQDNKGSFPPAHLHFITSNLHRWHGVRPKIHEPFEFEASPLKPYLQAVAIRRCPSFELVDHTQAFERAAGGYGYNNQYIGSGLAEPIPGGITGMAAYEELVVNRPARQTQIRRVAEKILFADTAMASPHLIEYSFVEPPILSGMPASPSIHFRHRRRANIAWADAHVSSELFEWTYPKNAYGASNERHLLGFFGPKNNALFHRR